MIKHTSIRYITQQQIDRQKWDARINASSNGLIYACSFYLDHMSRNWDALVLNDYEAVMPLTWNKKWGFYYLYQPFGCALLGVFGKLPANTTSDDFISAIPHHFKYWDINLNPSNNVSNSHKFRCYERKNFILSLDKHYTLLHAGFNDNIKRNIKKSEQLGCTVTNPGVDAVVKIARLQMQAFANTSDEDFERFTKLFHALEKRKAALSYGILDASGDLLSSCIFFVWKNRAYYILAGNSPAGRSSGASHALINAFIKDHTGTGIVLDFEGSDIPSLALFYKSFGAEEEIYPALRYNHLPQPFRWFKK